MLFPEEDAPLLKTWIVKRIENTSDADSDVLADYVIALLKHDGDRDAVRKLCEAEIPDFLTEEPKAFLDDVFQAITYRSYAPGAPPAPKLTSTTEAKQDQQPDTDAAAYNPRKRGIDESEGAPFNNFNPGFDGERAVKQPRRGGRNGRQQGFGPGMPQFDASNPIEAFMQMQQAMAMQFPGMAEQMRMGFGRGAPRQRRRGRCRDFDVKGYCSRGNTCMFDHGNESESLDYDESYDPREAMMHMAAMFNPMGNQRPNDNPRGGRNKRGRGGRKGGGRAEFSADGPVHDRSKTTIVVENIPEEHFTEEAVQNFFQQFGTVTNVDMRPYKRLAVVKFDTWDAANTAYHSPKVIFDNRFVKVFWYKEPGERATRNDGNGGGPSTGDDVEMQTQLDPEEFQRRQDEAQKLHDEREAKRLELEQQKQELEKKQQELLLKHREENEKLRAKLMPKDTESSEAGASEGTEMLRAKLAELEQEAKFLGIDPDASQDSGEYPPRGGYRGRVRGMRGRGRGGAPRGARGSFRGTARHATYAQYSLDNRPKTVALTGVDFTAPEKDEALRHLLLNTGEFTSIDTSAETTKVNFTDRKTAEKFYYTVHGNELPGIEGKIEAVWVNGPSIAAPAAVDKADQADLGDATASLSRDYDGQDDNRDDNRDDHGAGDDRVVDMDYEMPGDEHW